MVDQITDELGLENRAATDELPDATRLLFTFFRDDGDDNFLEMTETAIRKPTQRFKIKHLTSNLNLPYNKN